MSEQQSSGGNRPQNSNQNSGGGNNNNNRRHHNNNQRRRPQGQGNNPNQGQQQNRPQGGQQAQGGQSQGQGQGQGGGNRRRHRNHNRPRNPNQNQNQTQNQGQPGQGQHHPGGINLERIYEKYLNLLDQHLIARRKYHDLFYRADPAQKNKLERNFYNTLNDVRDFESKMAPEARALFEKRNNGLRPDNIYTSNHEISVEGEVPPPETEWEDPHFLQSQKVANYAEDKEESVGTLDDYLKYKNLV